MTDDQWLKAMRKYAGIDTLRDRGPETSGGELQLSQSLRSKVKANPKRFAALTARMAADLPASYFDAILQGVAEAAPPDEATSDGISLTDAVSLIERIHALPQRPCGRGITALVSKWRGLAWPPSIVEAIVWYAKEDPDPIEETWRRCTPSGQPNDDGDPDFAGLNSTRGSAANAVTALLFADRGPADLLIDAVDSLAHDASIAVRSQAAYALLALLNTHPDLSLQWFVECVSVDTVLLQTRFVEHFLRHAGHRHYVAIRPVLQGMIWCDNPRTTRVGASVCCMLALTVEEAAEDALQVRDGSSVMREAAVTIYATNVANKVVGPQCRELLLPFFADDEEIVRAIAATAFRHIAELDTKEQARLLGAFLDANPKALALRPVIHAIEHSPVRLPDLVCRLIETGVEHFKVDAGNIASHGALITRDLSKIVIRLYTQSDDDAIKTRCLDAIDGMEAVGFFGLSDELERIDR